MFSVERDVHCSHYTSISNDVLRDSRLSLSARGFFAVVLSLPENWNFSIIGMAQFLNIDKGTVLRYIRELESLGYAVVYSDSDGGKFSRKNYRFYENATENASADVSLSGEKTATENASADVSLGGEKTATENASPDVSLSGEKAATENASPDVSLSGEKTATENASPEWGIFRDGKCVTENAPQTNKQIKNKDKQNTVMIESGDEQSFSFIEGQINAEALSAEYGEKYINSVVAVIKDCMKAKNRTVSGESVDNAELVRVFGAVNCDDVRKAIKALDGKRFDSFSGYFGSVLFNQIKLRLDRPEPIKPRIASSLDLSDIDSEVLAKYHRSIEERRKQQI